MLDLSSFVGFMWDEGNDTKNWTRHRVTPGECEEVFFNRPLLLFSDAPHSVVEPRFYVLGRTAKGRKIFAVFTPRGDKIRIISARDMSRAERRRYAEEEA